MSKAFPKEIFVRWESDGAGGEYIAVDSLDDHAEAAGVGVPCKVASYKLAEKFTVTVEVQVKKVK